MSLKKFFKIIILVQIEFSDYYFKYTTKLSHKPLVILAKEFADNGANLIIIFLLIKYL